MKRYRSLNFSVSSLFFCFFQLGFCRLPSNQSSTMIRLYDMLQNNTGSSFQWNSSKNSNPCSWIGVSCSSNNLSVVRISLPWFSISSSEILPVLCRIDSLESLDLSRNQLTLIPDGFITGCGGINGLRLLNFSMNKLGGSLPTFNGFGSLEFLDLSHNFLSGNITLQLDGLDSIMSLNLSYNGFDGPVPSNLGRFNLLEELKLSYCKFEGEIPSEIVRYGNLTMIDLAVNMLSGSIPDRLGKLSRLKLLLLSSNHLTGEIPTSLSNIQTLVRFAAIRNDFVGNVPPGITTYLRDLDLSFNKLTGTIPLGLLSQPNLQSVDLSSNGLEGPIPTYISSSLVRLRLGSNLLNGILQSVQFRRLMSLTCLELENNTLTGPIPVELALCNNLILLHVSQNRLSGVLPAELGSLTNLRVLRLQQNNLNGTIPLELTRLVRLQRLNISWNSISGSIPDSISELTNLTNLDLRANQLSGSIPGSIGSLNSLIELQLGDNQLSGNIPPMPTLLQIALNLSNNRFEGSIPTTLSRLTALEVLDLSDNRFSGEIQDFLTGMTGLTQLILSNNQLSGVVPKFGSFVVVVLSGNRDLINTSSENRNLKKSEESTDVILIVSVLSGFIFGFSLAKVIPYIPRSSKRIKCHWIINDTYNFHKSKLNFPRAMEDVQREANIMSCNEFYTCYKVSMPRGMNYCIKKLYWSSRAFTLLTPENFSQELKLPDHLSGNSEIFMTPLAYALTSYCAFFVYECPEFGTLFDLLHGRAENVLDWGNRYRIAVRIATSLAFLHGFYSASAPIVLLNLSTRSIFMKFMSEPLIGDFELSKIISPSQSMGALSVPWKGRKCSRLGKSLQDSCKNCDKSGFSSWLLFC